MSIFIILISMLVLVFCAVYSISQSVKRKLRDKEELSRMSPDERKREMQRRVREAQDRKIEMQKSRIEEEQIWAENRKKMKVANAEKQKTEFVLSEFGSVNPAMTCPHCQTKGMVRTKHIVQKKGISGGKATAAVVTGGLSVLAVGLTRKEGATKAHCDNCKNTWLF